MTSTTTAAMQERGTPWTRNDLWRSARAVVLGAAVLLLFGCAATAPRSPPAVDKQPAAAAESRVVAPAQPRAAQADARSEPASRSPGSAAEAQARLSTPSQEPASVDAMLEGAMPSVGESRAESARSLLPDDGAPEVGLASWYGGMFQGRRTALGERFDMHRMTAAHKTMPLPSFALVRHQATGKEVVVRVNDRGPYVAGRIIDLSRAAALELGIHGVGRVEVLRLAQDDVRVHAWQAQARTALVKPRPRAEPKPRRYAR